MFPALSFIAQNLNLALIRSLELDTVRLGEKNELGIREVWALSEGRASVQRRCPRNFPGTQMAFSHPT